MLNGQFYNQNIVKCKETSSTQNNVDQTEEQKDFHVEKIEIAKETTDDGNEIVKKRKRLHQQSKKTKTYGWSWRKSKKYRSDKSK